MVTMRSRRASVFGGATGATVGGEGCGAPDRLARGAARCFVPRVMGREATTGRVRRHPRAGDRVLTQNGAPPLRRARLSARVGASRFADGGRPFEEGAREVVEGDELVDGLVGLAADLAAREDAAAGREGACMGDGLEIEEGVGDGLVQLVDAVGRVEEGRA